MPPASQTLLGACIEILASPHPPNVITRALIDTVFVRPLHQPFVTFVFYHLWFAL